MLPTLVETSGITEQQINSSTLYTPATFNPNSSGIYSKARDGTKETIFIVVGVVIGALAIFGIAMGVKYTRRMY